MKYENMSAERKAVVDERRAGFASENAKRAAIERVDAFLLEQLSSDFPIADTEAGMDAIRSIRTAIIPSARSAKLDTAVEQIQFSRTLKQTIRAGTKAEAEAFNVAAQEWPGLPT